MKVLLPLGLVLLSILGLIAIGAFLLMHGHPIAGGWLIAIGIVRYCGISVDVPAYDCEDEDDE